MPVFGKGRQGRKPKPELLEKQVSRRGKIRKYAPRYKWLSDTYTAGFNALSIEFPRVFGEGKHNFILQRFLEKKKPVVVLDWGCGKGVAAEEIAKKYGGKARVYGFSKDSYKEWNEMQNVKAIHATAEDLLRYLKDNSLDFVYSRVGLTHYPIEALNKSSLEEYLQKLAGKVSPGGMIVFSLESGRSFDRDALGQKLGENFRIETERKFESMTEHPGLLRIVYITKLK